MDHYLQNHAIHLAAEGLRAVASGDFILASSRTEAFGRLFGRDSLITSLQLLAALRHDPRLAPLLMPPIEGSLRALASLQGVMNDPWTEEEPGKIPHEYNAGGGGDFPGAYYASVDSTPLFLMALHEYDAVCGILGRGDGAQRGQAALRGGWEGSLLRQLRGARARALRWIMERADLDGDGLVEFLQRNPEQKSLINQNWRDSRDSLLDSGGQRPLYPVAYAEVQAYCYRAVSGEAHLRQLEDPEEAQRLQTWADRLARAFERRFWMPEAGCYGQALGADKHQLADVTSNAFHWLWLGPLRPRRFRKAAQRLLAPDMLTPFGLRTLSSSSPNYEPLRYHRGSIWPWDNWVAAGALRRLGMEGDACRIDTAVARSLTILGCPAELYIFRDSSPSPSTDFFDYRGQPARSCRIQAWTVGYLVEMIARSGMGPLLLGELDSRPAAPESEGFTPSRTSR